MRKTIPGKSFYSVLASVILILSAGSCAKIVPPTGGAKDTQPPVILESSPPSGSVFFSSKTISVTFDEYVVLDKLNEKFMISPPMDQKPDISVRGKTMRVVLNEDPRDSSTYTLYFQDAIKDLNEGNPLINYQYVFSTGSYIDSLSVTGNVVNASDLNPVLNTLVLLHRNLSDTAPRRQLPDYITIAGEGGYFRIDNVKGGSYRLYALSDNNGNRRYDLDDEMFAFSDSVISVNPERNYMVRVSDSLPYTQPGDTSVKEMTQKGDNSLFLFQAPPKKYYLTSSSRSQPYHLQYTLSIPPRGHAFDVDGIDSSRFIAERSREGDTINIWLLDSLLWSETELATRLLYPFTDSSGNVVSRRDTIIMRFFEQKPLKGKPAARKYVPAANISGGSLKPGESISFLFPSPCGEPDTSRINLYRIIRDGRTEIPYSLVPDTSSVTLLKLAARLAEGERYLLVTDRGAFRDIYGATSDSAGYSFTVRPANSFGRLILKTSGAGGAVIIQLLNNSEKVLREKAPDADGEVDFSLLERGRYRLRAIYDLNRDGKWTTGDFDSGLQPEPVSYFPDEIEIMVDWIIEQPWDLGTMYVKSSRLTGPNAGQSRQ